MLTEGSEVMVVKSAYAKCCHKAISHKAVVAFVTEEAHSDIFNKMLVYRYYQLKRLLVADEKNTSLFSVG